MKPHTAFIKLNTFLHTNLHHPDRPAWPLRAQRELNKAQSRCVTTPAWHQSTCFTGKQEVFHCDTVVPAGTEERHQAKKKSEIIKRKREEEFFNQTARQEDPFSTFLHKSWIHWEIKNCLGAEFTTSFAEVYVFSPHSINPVSAHFPAVINRILQRRRSEQSVCAHYSQRPRRKAVKFSRAPFVMSPPAELSAVCTGAGARTGGGGGRGGSQADFQNKPNSTNLLITE